MAELALTELAAIVELTFKINTLWQHHRRGQPWPAPTIASFMPACTAQIRLAGLGQGYYRKEKALAEKYFSAWLTHP